MQITTSTTNAEVVETGEEDEFVFRIIRWSSSTSGNLDKLMIDDLKLEESMEQICALGLNNLLWKGGGGTPTIYCQICLFATWNMVLSKNSEFMAQIAALWFHGSSFSVDNVSSTLATLKRHSAEMFYWSWVARWQQESVDCYCGFEISLELNVFSGNFKFIR